ncbi:MAG: type III pantothenate kinase [Chloroflexi bacterium]|nr:type III pantothenate kinase [Chloroflexota bacterium]
MLLAIDIGNTNVTLGVFEGETLRGTWRFASDPKKMPDEYAVQLLTLLPRAGIDFSQIDEAVLCSSVPPLVVTFDELCQRYFGVKPLVMAAGIKTGIRVRYENPREVGADRVADAVAAFHMYGAPLIVVDCGTATVFDAVTAEGDYLGGAIAPGIYMALDALISGTAMLRRVELVRPKQAIGRNTVHSIQSGLIFGYVGLVEGVVARFKEELGGEARVIGTGGLAAIIARETPVIELVDPDLTLHGLRIIYDLNREH